jgi:hypothetical protein
MSSAFYPLGMKSYNNYTPQGGYKTWKGANEFQNPVGITSSNQRPQTNKDYRNVAVYKHGLPRPMKHYRKGTSIPISNGAIENYYSNRQVASSTSNASVGQLIDRPGSVSTKPVPTSSGECNTCLGQSIVSGWAPIQNLTEKPQPNTENATLCCNAQKKARKRVLPASTILKKNYYTTHSQYMYNRCQTFEQRAFNFYSGPQTQTPESSPYEYTANCSPNVIINDAVVISIINRVAFVLKEENIITQEEYDAFLTAQIVTMEAFIAFLTNDVANSSEALASLYKVLNNNYLNGGNDMLSNSTNGCKKVIYKPNNYQYAQQGAVTGSARVLRLNVNTIDKYISNIKAPTNTMIYKNKVEKCNPAYYRKDGDRIQCKKV